MDSVRVGGSDADRVQGLCERIDLLLDLNRPQEALPLVARALTLDPTSITAHCHHARIWKALGNVPTALKAAEAAISLDPEEEWGHRLRALILLDAGEEEEALAAALVAVRLDPERFQVLQCVVQCAVALRRYPLARVWAERGRDLYPGDATFHGWLGTVSIHEGNWSEAETHLRRALEIDPACHAHAFNLGLVFKYQGRQRAAIAAFYQAAQLTPTDSSSQEQLYDLVSKAVAPARGVAILVALIVAVFGARHLGRAGWVLGPVVGIAAYFAWERWWLGSLSGSISDFYQRRRQWQARQSFGGMGGSVRQFVDTVLSFWLCLIPLQILLLLVLLSERDWLNVLLLVGSDLLAWKLRQRAPATSTDEPDVYPFPPEDEDLDEPDETPGVPAPLVQLRAVAYATPPQVDAVFGHPRSVAPVLTQPELMPGEYREYLLKDQNVVLVRFFHDQAVSFSVRTERALAEGPVAALRAFFGLDAAGLTTWRCSAAEHAWAGTTGGLSFSRLGVSYKGQPISGAGANPRFNAAEALLPPSGRKN